MRVNLVEFEEVDWKVFQDGHDPLVLLFQSDLLEIGPSCSILIFISNGKYQCGKYVTLLINCFTLIETSAPAFKRDAMISNLQAVTAFFV